MFFSSSDSKYFFSFPISFCILAKILYYERFSYNDYNPPGYDTNYCGSTESWPSSTYGTTKWDSSNSLVANEFVGWGGWNSYVTSHGDSFIQKCGSESIFGGYDVFGDGYWATKTFTHLPAHTGVEVDLSIAFVDSWDYGEYFFVKVDSTTIISKENVFVNNPLNLCGGKWADNLDTSIISGSTAHTLSTMTVKFDSTLNQALYDESWGIKNLKIYLITSCPIECITCSGSSCLTCPSFSKLSGSTCICMNNFYMVSSPYTRCQKCDLSCKTCNSGTSSSCTSCYPEYTLNSGVCSPPSSKFLP